jgi:hypothetical protein
LAAVADVPIPKAKLLKINVKEIGCIIEPSIFKTNIFSMFASERFHSNGAQLSLNVSE